MPPFRYPIIPLAPPFHRKGIHDRFSLTNVPFGIRDCKIRISRPGWVRMNESLRFSGKILAATDSRTADRTFDRLPSSRKIAPNGPPKTRARSESISESRRWQRSPREKSSSPNRTKRSSNSKSSSPEACRASTRPQRVPWSAPRCAPPEKGGVAGLVDRKKGPGSICHGVMPV